MALRAFSKTLVRMSAAAAQVEAKVLDVSPAVITPVVLKYWFEGVGPGTANAQMGKWFGGKDADLPEKFQAPLEAIVADPANVDAFTATGKAEDRLALVIMLDQFSRVVYKGKGEAFANDALAVKLAKEGIALGQDAKLEVPRRVFLYMPLMHSEDLSTQELGVERFTALEEEAKTNEYKNDKIAYLSFQIAHRDVIKRFGRFPMRNKALGRDSSPEELEYIESRKGNFF